METQKYKLHVEKSVNFYAGKYNRKARTLKIYFSVLDCESYPRDFVCFFPKNTHILLKAKGSSSFAFIFKDVDRIQFAIQLLHAAKAETSDIDILNEIAARLKILDIKPIESRVCHCGKAFTPKRKTTLWCDDCQETYKQKFNEPKTAKPKTATFKPKIRAYWVSKSVREAHKNGAFSQ
jgi:hypothetical protein